MEKQGSSLLPGSFRLAGQQGALFLALTFVLVIIIVLMSPDAMTALVIVGLLLGLALAYNSMGGRGGGHGHDHGGDDPQPSKEGFYLPGAPAPYAVSAPRLPARPRSYPGAIDIDEYDTEPGRGHRDRTEGDNDFAPDGNPFNLNRVGASHAASACVDDEANDDELDGDERMTYQARSRNDPARVTAGTMNRRRDLDKYLREEVDEEDDREWWGRHED